MDSKSSALQIYTLSISTQTSSFSQKKNGQQKIGRIFPYENRNRNRSAKNTGNAWISCRHCSDFAWSICRNSICTSGRKLVIGTVR